MPKDPTQDPLIACCCVLLAVDFAFPDCCAVDFQETCICCEGGANCKLKSPILPGIKAKGQSLCCNVVCGCPPGKDLEGTTVPLKFGCCGVFPIGGDKKPPAAAAGAPASVEMAR